MTLDQWEDLGLFTAIYPDTKKNWFDKADPDIRVIITPQKFRDDDRVFHCIWLRYMILEDWWNTLYVGRYANRDEAEKVVVHLILRGANYATDNVESYKMEM